MTDLPPIFPDSSCSFSAGGTAAPAAAPQIRINPENVRNGLLKLVLTLIELLRELLERQALRRIDGGSLSVQEIERLKQQFGLTDEDLNLDLGPLGKLR